VHSGDELDCALQAGAEIIGINVRDLATFRLQAGLVESLVPLIPSGKTIVAESGLQTAQEFSRMRELGVHAALVGEALMTAPDVRTKLRELLKHG
jgi:indole-3-glycerol phosphate synthase